MKNFYRTFLAFLTILMLLPVNPTFADDFDFLETEKPVFNPLVKLVTPTVIEIQGGSTEIFDISVKNSGSGSAQNFIAQANISTDAPFTVSFVNNSNTVSTINTTATRRLRMQISVDRNAPSGTYPIELNYNYKNAYNENFSESDTIMVRIENTVLGPNISLTNFNSDKPSISPGDTFTLSSTIENNSNQQAFDVQILIEGLETSGVHLSNSVQNIYYRNFNYGVRENISFDFKVAPDAKRGTYPIVFILKYKDGTGEEFEKEHYYYVSVRTDSDTSESADIQILHMDAPTGTYGVGEEFAISLDIKNTGSAAARNIRISTINDDSGAIVPKSASIRSIASLAPDSSENLIFTFAPTSQSVSQNYTIGFKVEYDTGNENSDGTNEIMSFSQYAGVNVFNPENEDDDSDDDRISIPKIIVSQYAVNPQIVSAGQEFDLDLTFLNTHSNKSIENVKAYIVMEDRSTAANTTEDKGNVFSPVNGSNTFYIDSISPKSETKHSLRLFCIPDASAKTYTLTVKFEYQDTDYNTYTEEALIGITVKQTTRLETSDISINTFASLYEPVPISFQLYNMGKVTLSNLMVSIEAPGFDTVTTESTVYYGRFQPSDSNYYDGFIIPHESGLQPVTVVISFEDDAAERHTVEREFMIDVAEPFMMSEEDMMMFEQIEPERNGSFLGKGFIIIGSAATVLILFGGGIFLFNKKKQKGIEFDE